MCGDRRGVVGVGVGAYTREASGRCQDLSDTTDPERGDTLVGMYFFNKSTQTSFSHE